MNRDLFLSILALDSYNHGYGVRINVPGTAGQLGTATFSRQSDVRANSDAVNAGFYAIAYDWNGETVISFRGTDGLLIDALNGYGLGAGFATSPQGDLALAFYHAVTQFRGHHAVPGTVRGHNN